jgi:hypothetical protein
MQCVMIRQTEATGRSLPFGKVLAIRIRVRVRVTLSVEWGVYIDASTSALFTAYVDECRAFQKRVYHMSNASQRLEEWGADALETLLSVCLLYMKAFQGQGASAAKWIRNLVVSQTLHEMMAQHSRG